MGYFNPILQYGVEEFCVECKDVGVDGVIIPDLPVFEYEINYKSIFEKYGIHFIFLVSPQTSEERLNKIEELTTEEIIQRINDGHLDAAIAATPLENDNIKERVLYFEPFVAYVPKDHKMHQINKIVAAGLLLKKLMLPTDFQSLRANMTIFSSTIKLINAK